MGSPFPQPNKRHNHHPKRTHRPSAPVDLCAFPPRQFLLNRVGDRDGIGALDIYRVAHLPYAFAPTFAPVYHGVALYVDKASVALRHRVGAPSRHLLLLVRTVSTGTYFVAEQLQSSIDASASIASCLIVSAPGV